MKKEDIAGLSHQEAQNRLREFGKNALTSDASSSTVKIFVSQFPTLINGILGLASLFSFILNHTLDGFLILAVIILNGVLGFIQEFRAQKSMEKLKDYTAPTARVIREGREEEILAEKLVPGDIVILSEGSRVPADGVLIEVTHLEVDESILSGESLPVMKKNSESVFLGTLVTKGKGYFKIEKTGMKTRFGQVAGTLSTLQADKTPLQKNLDHLGKILSISVLLVGLMIVPIGLYHGGSLLPLILVAASIGVAAIPEGLPTVVTVAFAVGAHRMAKRGAIVRKMAAIETLGAVQVILSDKTGTITENKMRVKKNWMTDASKTAYMLRACVLGNTASLIEKGGQNKFEIVGDQTDGALLLWARDQKDYASISDQGKIVDEFVFDPEYKTITTVWENAGHKYVYVRGAPEAIIAKSNLSHDKKEEAELKIKEFAKEGLRIIAFAYKIEKSKGKLSRDEIERDLIFLGLTGIYDPPREEVKEAIKKSRKAGIQVIMVTGDNELTALSLAKDVGLIEEDEDVVTGEELAKLTDEELLAIIQKTRIFARTQPEEKLRLVTVLKKSGHIIGVTGDGVNDALALKKADVGVAMGNGGTDVAKEAADIVLTNDSFATLIRAIEEGRIIYNNISNAVVYLISGNLAQISLVFFANLFNLPFILLPTQILWVNLITDSLPALALATGARDASVINKKPRDPKTTLLSGNRTLKIALIGLSVSGILLLFFAYLLHIHGAPLTQARTAVFNLLVYLHLIIVLVIGWQSLRKGNMFLVITVIIIFFLQIAISTIPFFQAVFHL